MFDEIKGYQYNDMTMTIKMKIRFNSSKVVVWVLSMEAGGGSGLGEVRYG